MSRAVPRRRALWGLASGGPTSGGARPSTYRPRVERLEDRTVPSTNPIVAENQLPGTPMNVWGVGTGDSTIQGFATDISVDHGQTVSFKINDSANKPYHIDIYRMGYYGGTGTRLVTTIDSSRPSGEVGLKPAAGSEFSGTALTASPTRRGTPAAPSPPRPPWP